MDRSSAGSDNEKRLSLSFHRTFSLSRESVRTILNLVISDTGLKSLTNKQLAEKTNLGSIYIEAMPRYAYGSGLTDKEREPSDFGRMVFSYDPLLLHPSTLWLMHYFMSAPHGPGPFFWNRIITNLFKPGEEFSDADLLSCIKEDNEGLKEDTISEAKTAFIGTYVKQDGLGALGLISEGDTKNKFVVNYPEPPSVWTMGVAFIDYCQAQFPGVKVIGLSNILDDSDFAKIFMVGTRRINHMLSQLQEAGYVEVFNSVPPYGVAILRTDIAPLLERMYGNEELD